MKTKRQKHDLKAVKSWAKFAPKMNGREINMQLSFKQIYKILEKKIKTEYGSKCRDFVYGCPTCGVYLMLEILQECVFDEGEN